MWLTWFTLPYANGRGRSKRSPACMAAVPMELPFFRWSECHGWKANQRLKSPGEQVGDIIAALTYLLVTLVHRILKSTQVEWWCSCGCKCLPSHLQAIHGHPFSACVFLGVNGVNGGYHEPTFAIMLTFDGLGTSKVATCRFWRRQGTEKRWRHVTRWDIFPQFSYSHDRSMGGL